MSRDYWGADKDPAHTSRRVLEVLAELHPYMTKPKRWINRQVSGTDLAGASHVYAAIGRLRNRRIPYVIEVRKDAYKITEAGRSVLYLAQVLDAAEADEPEGAA